MDSINTNVGDMPLDIFSDYISDVLGEEWSWEYLGSIFNNRGYYFYDEISNGVLGNGFGNYVDEFFGDGYNHSTTGIPSFFINTLYDDYYGCISENYGSGGMVILSLGNG